VALRDVSVLTLDVHALLAMRDAPLPGSSRRLPDFRALLNERDALLIGSRGLLTGSRALLMGSRALLTGSDAPAPDRGAIFGSDLSGEIAALKNSSFFFRESALEHSVNKRRQRACDHAMVRGQARGRVFSEKETVR
jgi:hypothetical protein